MTAYVVMVRKKMTDPAEFHIYRSKAPLAREGHALTPLASYGALDSLEGEAPDGVVILSFPSVEEARGWYDSPLYQAAREHRQRGAEYDVFIVEGVPAKP